ncbi:MAG TPA: thiamine phosphate synthase [Candidatus Limnocylindria bacterium]|nr:thiamine phosphate synthase [Candidatus Limnocylindria bacterium]
MSGLAFPPLYAIVDPLDTGRDPVALARALLAGGARLLQLRLKDVPTRTLLSVASAIRTATREAGALFVVNDRPDVARLVGADGVHLGPDDVPVHVARLLLPPPALIGVSTHDDVELAAALAAGPDYVAVGPIAATTSKADARTARGLAVIAEARRRTRLPVVAIGGLTPETAVAAVQAGAHSVALIGALVRAPDVAAATRALIDALARAQGSRPPAGSSGTIS